MMSTLSAPQFEPSAEASEIVGRGDGHDVFMREYGRKNRVNVNIPTVVASRNDYENVMLTQCVLERLPVVGSATPQGVRR